MTERIKLILCSGDGSFERPYIVKNVKDQYLLVGHFGSKVRAGNCIGGDKIWLSRNGCKVPLDVSFMRKMEKMPKDQLRKEFHVQKQKMLSAKEEMLGEWAYSIFQGCNSAREVRERYQKESGKLDPKRPGGMHQALTKTYNTLMDAFAQFEVILCDHKKECERLFSSLKTEDGIRRAYRKAALKTHPDIKGKGDPFVREQFFKNLNDAYNRALNRFKS